METAGIPLSVLHAPVTPVQHFFFEHILPNPHHFNQVAISEVQEALDTGLLQRAIQHIHDALRLRAVREESG